MSSSASAGRPTPTSYLDRTWLDHWTVLTLTPIQPPDISELRSNMAEFMTSDPRHPLCCTLSADGRRWLPLPPNERQRHVSEVIVEGGAIDTGDPFPHLDANRPDPASTAPFKVVVGPDSVTCYFAHACGDAAVFSPFSVLMALGDVAGLKPLRADAGLGLALRIFGRELPSHWRDWWRHARAKSASAQPAADERTTLKPVTPSSTVATGIVLSAEEFAAFTTWRKTNHPKVSATALMASAVYLALAAEGLPIDDNGFFTLVDLRRHLPKKQGMRPGNLAKSAYVNATMSDPQSVGTSLKQMVDTARAVPALLSGAVTAALGGPAAETTHVSKTVTMTFNSMMRNPGIEHIPWIDPAHAQYITMSYPIGADGISISACAVEGRVSVSASFDPASLHQASVHRALCHLRDMPALLERRAPVPADPIPDTAWITDHSAHGAG